MVADVLGIVLLEAPAKIAVEPVALDPGRHARFGGKILVEILCVLLLRLGL